MPIKISKKLFAAIRAGNLIKDTSLEGGDIRDSFEFIVSYFNENKQNQFQTEVNQFSDIARSVTKMQDQLFDILYGSMIWADDPETIITKKKKLQSNNEPFEKLARSFIANITGLKPGKKIVIPGGIVGVGGNGGHAMLYAVEMTADGDYQFKIYNTGQGSETTHGQALVKGSEIFEVGNHVFTIEGLKLDNFQSQAFAQAVSFALQQQVRPAWDQKEAHIGDIYDVFKIALADGKIKQTEFADLHKMQKAGNCYYYVLKPLLRELIPKNYDEIQMDIKLKSILAFYQENKDKLDSDLESYHLLKFAIRKLSNATNKRWQSEATSPRISQEMAQVILKECVRLESELEQLHQTKTADEKYQFDLQAFTKPDNRNILN